MVSPRFLHLLLFFLLASLASSTTLSNEIFEGLVVPGRTLLQQKSSCSVDFENQNYTIMTSQCKGPNYQPEPCCKALMELACPFSEELNDMKNDCATTFFSYINVYGKYPPGLFANMCHGSKDGLDCSQIITPPHPHSSSSSSNAPPLPFPFLTPFFLTLLLFMFQHLLILN